MKPRVSKLHLRLHTRNVDDQAPRGGHLEEVEQGRLADTGVALQHQRLTVSITGDRHEFSEVRALAAPTDQVVGRVGEPLSSAGQCVVTGAHCPPLCPADAVQSSHRGTHTRDGHTGWVTSHQ